MKTSKAVQAQIDAAVAAALANVAPLAPVAVVEPTPAPVVTENTGYDWNSPLIDVGIEIGSYKVGLAPSSKDILQTAAVAATTLAVASLFMKMN